MKIICTLLFITFTSLIFSQSKEFRKLDELFKTSLVKWNVPGMAIAIVKDDSLVFAEGYGVGSVDTQKNVDKNTIFAIASNTKAFTATGLAMLVDQNKIGWKDKVGDYISYFNLYDPYVSSEITIEDLLSHRSGLKTFSGDLIWYGSDYSREEIIKRAKYLEPKYPFRTEFGYSNIMYLTAGEIIPVVTDTSWDDFMKYRIFQPLGMRRTFTSIENLKSLDNVAMPHNDVNGTNINIGYINWDNIGPAGSINSSAYDLSKWLKFQLNYGVWNGKLLVSEEQLREMRHPHINKRIGKGSEAIWPSKHFNSYGMGWDLMDYHGYKIINHGGGYDGMISRTVLVPELDLGFVILTNNINSLPYALMFSILDHFIEPKETKEWTDMFLEFEKAGKEAKEREAYAEEQKRVPNTKPTLPLEKYVGTYGGEMYGNAEVKLVDGNLEVQFIPSPIFHGKLTHWHYNTFIIEMTNVPSLPKGKCTFKIDPFGEVEEMNINIPNPDFDFTELVFKRIK